ncbi:Hypothetical predicted protein [Podarcis lilfordi]|uniref:Uncharacterized protein n=1 Tax=Podarcis lilfordi TaxID=74358 RepID=A0AA35PJ14_9SAUR|nr:Hypothetical predicted protein [Podarcis lilfordi]
MCSSWGSHQGIRLFTLGRNYVDHEKTQQESLFIFFSGHHRSSLNVQRANPMPLLPGAHKQISPHPSCCSLAQARLRKSLSLVSPLSPGNLGFPLNRNKLQPAENTVDACSGSAANSRFS